MASNLPERVERAIKYILSLDTENLKCGKYEVDDEFFYLVSEYETKPSQDCRFEAHKSYVDIQYIAKGEEYIAVTASAFLSEAEPYNPQNDIVFFSEPKMAKSLLLREGSYEVFYPKDAHKPSIAVDSPKKVLKIVGKVLI